MYKDKKNKIKWTTNLFSIVNLKKKKKINLLNKKKIKWTKFNFFKIVKNKLSLCNITLLKKKVKWLNFDLLNIKKKKYWTKSHFFKIFRIRGEHNWSNVMSLNKKLRKFLKHKTIYYINTTKIKKINQSISPYQYCYNEYLLDKELNKKYKNFKDFKNDLIMPNIIVDNNPLIPFHYHIEYDKDDLLEYYYKTNVINFNKFSNIIIKNYNTYHKNEVNVFKEIYNNYDENNKNINKIKHNFFNNKKYNFKKKKKNYFKYLNKNNNKKINFNDQLYTSEYLESIIKKPIIIPENNLNFLNWFFKFNFNSFIDGFCFYLYLYYHKIQIIFFNFLKMFIIPNKIYSYFIFKIKKLYNYIIKTINETKSFYVYLNQYFKNLEIKYLNTIINSLNYFIKIYYFIILKYILTPFFLLINVFEKLQFIYQDFLIKNFNFYYIDLIIIYLKTFL